MLYRLNRMFNVSKAKAAAVSILCFIAAIPFFFMGELAMIGLALMGYALIYGGIWYHKFQRDTKLAAPKPVPETPQIEPIQTVTSSRLFVPKPLDD